jgi:hypothetical protein
MRGEDSTSQRKHSCEWPPSGGTLKQGLRAAVTHVQTVISLSARAAEFNLALRRCPSYWSRDR